MPGNELHSSGSFILRSFIMFVLFLFVVTLSYATISVVPGRASVFKSWVWGFCVWWGDVCFKPIAQESPLLKWKPFRWNSSQLSTYWPKSNPSFSGDRVAFVLAVPCDQSGSIAMDRHLCLEALLDPFSFNLLWGFPYALSVRKPLITSKCSIIKRGASPCCVLMTSTLLCTTSGSEQRGV